MNRISLSILLGLLFLSSTAAKSHSEGLDSNGCQDDRDSGEYHCGPWRNHPQKFASKAEYLKAVEARTRCEAGVSHFEGRDRDGARIEFEECLKIDPTYWECRQGLRWIEGIGFEVFSGFCSFPAKQLPEKTAITDQYLRRLLADLKDSASRWGRLSPNQRATYTLEELAQTDSRVVRILVDAIRNDSKLRFPAANALGRIAHTVQDAVPALIDLSDSESLEIRSAVTTAFFQAGSSGQKGIPILLKFLNSDEIRLRYKSAFALAQVDPGQSEAVPILIQILQQGTTDEQILALQCLEKIQPPPTSAIKPIIRTLEYDNMLTRDIYALRALMRMGPAAKEAVPIILKGLDDPHFIKSSHAAAALISIAPPGEQAIPMLMKGLMSGNNDIVVRSREYLTKIGTPRALEVIAAHDHNQQGRTK